LENQEKLELENQEKFEGSVELAKMGFDRFNKRRDFEMKINWGVWTVLAIMIGFGIAGERSDQLKVNGAVFLLTHLFAFSAYGIWMAGLQCSNKVDQRFAFFYEDMAERILRGDGTVFDYQSKSSTFFKLGGMRSWAIISEVGFTLVLLVANVLVYWKRLY
jgi:formate hydrogenlyase subunit 4